MESIKRVLIFTAIMILLNIGMSLKVNAQCTGGTSAGTITPNAAWQTFCIQGGQYVTFSAIEGRYYTFSFCQGGGSAPTWDDTQINILDNTGATIVASNDDYCGWTSHLVFLAPATATYRVLVTKWYCSTDATCQNMAYQTTIPANDEICNATHIYSNGCSCSYNTHTNDLATKSATTPNPTCNFGASSKDVWFTTKVPTSGEIQINTQAGGLIDAVMAVYSGSSCGAALTQIACVNDVGANKMPSLTLTGQTPGDTLFIRIWGRLISHKGSFGICVYDLNPFYCMTGSASEIYPGNCIQTNLNGPDQASAIWNKTQISLSSSFDYTFTVNLGSNDWGADGMTFTLHNNPAGTSLIGSNGGSMGLNTNMTKSLSVEFDTYNNGGGNADIPEDHISIDINGDVSAPVAGPVQASSTSTNIEDGLDHTVRVTWNPATTVFTVYFDGVARLTYTNDIINNLFGGSSMVYWGFTASTGLFYNSQTFCPGNLPGAPMDPLPVTWSNVNAELIEGKVLIHWTTVSESLNEEFLVERSVDGTTYLPIGSVSGQGNSNYAVNYQFLDVAPLSGISYYKIRQNDINGTSSLSPAVTIENYAGSGSKKIAKIYPNPTTPSTVLYAELVADAQLEVYDNMGNIVLKESVNKGLNTLNILEGYLQPGLYHFVVKTSEVAQFVTMIVQSE